MKIAIIGPVHPYKGGIAQHTTELAHRLTDAGNEVTVISWKTQYPFFYPGEQFVANDKPELPVFENSKRVMSWKNPLGWRKWAKKLKNYDEVIFVWWVPTVQGPVYDTMMRTLGKKGPRKLILCHNVIQHSAGPLDNRLTKRVFNKADAVLVHTEALANRAKELTKTPVIVSNMPAHLPNQPKQQAAHSSVQKHVLFFGLVRQYKGVDILLKALEQVPEITLTVAGEMWGKQQAKLNELVEELGLKDRVTLLPGYVPAENIAGLFKQSDALVMPYRAGTASHTSALAFTHGVPVIATKVGSMPQQIRDGVDGLLCDPESPESLAAAIKHFYEPGVAQKLFAGIPNTGMAAEKDWADYVIAITSGTKS